MSKDYWKKILMRAWHAVWETAAATLPATIVITPAMIEHFDKSILVAIAAWLTTALVAGVVSIIKSLAIGIPEASIEDETDYIEEIDLGNKFTIHTSPAVVMTEHAFDADLIELDPEKEAIEDYVDEEEEGAGGKEIE